MLNSTLNSSMRGVVVSPANLCRGPCYMILYVSAKFSVGISTSQAR